MEAKTILSSTDGTRWQEETSPTANDLYSVVFADGLWVAVGGSGTILTSRDARQWSLLAIESAGPSLRTKTCVEKLAPIDSMDRFLALKLSHTELLDWPKASNKQDAEKWLENEAMRPFGEV